MKCSNWRRVFSAGAVVVLMLVSLVQAGAAAAVLPASCADVKGMNLSAGNGEYYIFPGGKVMKVYCADMNGTPKEFLTLQKTGGSYNYSYYAEGQNTGPAGVTTHFTKVRLNPGTLEVTNNDYTFSTSSGSFYHFGPNYFHEAPWANAADCRYPGSNGGRANVDLTGTSFAVAQGQLSTGGFIPNGSFTYSVNDQIVNLTGGGYCGWTGPSGSTVKLVFTGQMVGFDALRSMVAEMVSNPDVVAGLTDKLNAAEAAYARGNAKAMQNNLGAFSNQVKAQTWKAISSYDAQLLMMLAGSL